MTGLLRQSVRFGVVGLANTLIGLAAIYGVLFFFGASAELANAVGYVLGLGVSFGLNKIWTFGSRLPAASLLPRYLLVVAVAYLLNLGTVAVLASMFAVNPYAAQLPGMVLYTACVFVGCRRFVFASPAPWPTPGRAP